MRLETRGDDWGELRVRHLTLRRVWTSLLCSKAFLNLCAG